MSETPTKSRFGVTPITMVAMKRTILIVLLAGMVFAVFFWVNSKKYERPPEPGMLAGYDGGGVYEDDVHEYLHRGILGLMASSRDSTGKVLAHASDPAMIEDLVRSIALDRLTHADAETRQLAEDEEFSHLMKHVSEEVKMAEFHEGMHSSGIEITETAIQQYYEENPEKYRDRTLAEVRQEIRAVLMAEEEKAYMERILHENRESVVDIMNPDLLRVEPPSEAEMRNYYWENRDEFRESAKVKVWLVTPDSAFSDVEAIKFRLYGSAGLAELTESYPDLSFVERWVAQDTATGYPANLSERFPGDVLGVIKLEGKDALLKIVDRQPARVLEFEEVRQRILDRLASNREERVLKGRADQVLFSVHGRPYTVGDFLKEYEEMSPAFREQYDTFEKRKQLVHSLLDRAIFVEEATHERGEDAGAETIESARKSLLHSWYHKDVVDVKIPTDPQDKDLKAFFDQNREYYRRSPRVQISYILVWKGRSEGEEEMAREKIKAARKALKKQSFEEVASAFSEDRRTAERGGALDRWITETDDPLVEMYEHGLHQRVLNMKAGEVSETVEGRDNFTIIKIREREEAQVPSFDEVRELVKADYLADLHNRLVDENAERLLREANFVMYHSAVIEMAKKLKQSEYEQGYGKRRKNRTGGPSAE